MKTGTEIEAESEKKGGLRRLLTLGLISALTYMVVYTVRNILGAVSPQMLDEGAFDVIAVGKLSSTFFFSYGIGQLFNGMIGERLKTRTMVTCGLLLACLGCVAFVLCRGMELAPYLAYGAVGVALSMIYGPLVKLGAENLSPAHSVKFNLFLALASAAGAPLSGLIASAVHWDHAFFIGAGALFLMCIVVFFLLIRLEHRGEIRYGTYVHKKEDGNVVRVLIEHRIVKFTLVAMITGIVRTSVVFWLPTFYAQYLGFPPETAALFYTFSTLIISFEPLLSVTLRERLHKDLDWMILASFIASAACFFLAFLSRNPYLGMASMALAIMTSNSASSMLWVCYCPGLRDTGLTSTATGYLDFMSYMAAAISSALFANAVDVVGWKLLILIWVLILCGGIMVALPWKKKED